MNPDSNNEDIFFEKEMSDGELENCQMVRRGFYVEPLIQPIDLDFVPTNGHEYIHRMRLENAMLDQSMGNEYIHKMRLENATLDQSIQEVPITEDDKDQKEDLKRWGRQMAKDFSMMAMALKSQKSKLIIKFPKQFELPQLEEKWCLFCLGSRLYSKIYSNEKVAKSKGHPPHLSIVLHLTQKEIKMLLRYHCRWVNFIGIKNSNAIWIYSLFACLEKPLDDKTAQFLAEFHDTCKTLLKTGMATPKKRRTVLVVSLLKQYFLTGATHKKMMGIIAQMNDMELV